MIESARPISGSRDMAADGRPDASTRSPLQTLARQAAGLSWSSIPAEVQDRTLLVLFDSLGVMLAGAATPEVQALAAQFGEVGSSPLVGFGRATSADAACWVNGTAVCSLELDEGSKYARGHPAAHVLPAVLAVGAGHRGSDWLAAFLAGYETAARFGRATRLRSGVHPHGTWGATGAAAAAARLARLDGDGMATAIDAATGLALAPHFDSALSGNPVRNLWVGAANAAGLAAARLAASGTAVYGDTASLTLGQVLGDFDPTPLARPFDERFDILGGYFKRHAACAYTHAPADAILALRENGLFDPDDVETVTVETFAIAAGLNRTEWPTRLAAMFSIPYVAAAMLLDGSFGPDASSDARRADPVLGELARRVEVKATDEFETRLPERRGARVTVQMYDGSKRSAEVEQPIGDSAHHPLGWDEIRTKLSDLIGTDRTMRLETAVRALPSQPADTLLEEVMRS